MSQSKYETTKVLNISNTTSTGLVVLNDLRLLEIMQHYPFLYNPGVNPSKDPHYDRWAWQCIAKKLNQSYLPIKVTFTANDCETRWNCLQTVVVSLSMAFKRNNIPENLRNIISSIATDMQTIRRTIEYTPAQNFLFSQVEFVEKLPASERRKLEADMMELIIDTELKAKGTVALGLSELEQIDREYDDFLRSIRLKELFVVASENNSQEQSTEPNQSQVDSHFNSTESKAKTTTVLTSKIEIKQEKFPDEENIDVAKVSTATATASSTSTSATPSPYFSVPLQDAHLYVKPCKVRLKNCNLDELTPLALLRRTTTPDSLD